MTTTDTHYQTIVTHVKGMFADISGAKLLITNYDIQLAQLTQHIESLTVSKTKLVDPMNIMQRVLSGKARLVNPVPLERLQLQIIKHQNMIAEVDALIFDVQAMIKSVEALKTTNDDLIGQYRDQLRDIAKLIIEQQ